MRKLKNELKLEVMVNYARRTIAEFALKFHQALYN